MAIVVEPQVVTRKYQGPIYADGHAGELEGSIEIDSETEANPEGAIGEPSLDAGAEAEGGIAEIYDGEVFSTISFCEEGIGAEYSGLSRFRNLSVSYGSGVVCVHKSDGSIVCWGNNRNGRAMATSGNFARISDGGGACAIKSDGSIVCWANDAPRPPSGLFTQVSASYGLNEREYCAIRDDGTIVCWGDSGQYSPPSGAYIQLSSKGPGINNTVYPNCAVRSDGSLVCWDLEALNRGRAPDGCYVQVAGECAIKSDGSVLCWGCRYEYVWESRFPYFRPVGCGILTGPTGDFTQITVISDYAAVYGHYCGLKRDGSIICWSWDALNDGNGNINPGDFYEISVPIDTYTQISGSCAVRSDESVVCWALDYDESMRRVAIPFSLPLGPYVEVSGSCAIKSDSAIVCWNRLGTGEVLWDLVSVNGPPGIFAQLKDSCGLKSNGTITCFSYGTAADTTTVDYETFDLPGSYIQLGATSRYQCALTIDGSVTCWDKTSPHSDNYTYVLVSAPSGKFTQLNGSCALDSDGVITCWDWDRDQFGDPIADALFLVDAPSGTYTQVSGVEGNTCALKSESSVTCWGNNNYGQADAPAGPFTQISTSNELSCALRDDGSIHCWGWEAFDRTASPPGVYTHVYAQDSGSCAIRLDGSVVCWGNNSDLFLPATF